MRGRHREMIFQLKSTANRACYRTNAASDAAFRNTEEDMRALKVLVASCIMTSAVMPAFADDMAPSMGMMKGGEVIAIMPDGHKGTMMVDEGAAMKMMGVAKPIDHCTMMMQGSDGKTYMVDTSSSDATMECEKMAK
jgi:hypothetical protein